MRRSLRPKSKSFWSLKPGLNFGTTLLCFSRTLSARLLCHLKPLQNALGLRQFFHSCCLLQKSFWCFLLKLFSRKYKSVFTFLCRPIPMMRSTNPTLKRSSWPRLGRNITHTPPSTKHTSSQTSPPTSSSHSPNNFMMKWWYQGPLPTLYDTRPLLTRFYNFVYNKIFKKTLTKPRWCRPKEIGVSLLVGVKRFPPVPEHPWTTVEYR